MPPPSPTERIAETGNVRNKIYTDRQDCQYSIRNPWSQPLGRIADFLPPFTLPPLYYVEAPRAHLVSLVGVARPCQILHETTPFLRLEGPRALRLGCRAHLPASARIPWTLCSLVDFRGWSGYFHWFLDFLPRILAAEHHSRSAQTQVKFLVPAALSSWQAESLARLGITNEDLIAHDPSAGRSNILAKVLLAASSHRHQHCNGAPFDAISPLTVRELQHRLQRPADDVLAGELPQKVFISRRGANSRRITNESEVSSYLESHGFATLQLETLSLAQQIVLFRHATHVIALHGAGLTNLIHACSCAVLELFPSGHGIRPDYYQLASIHELPYFFHSLPSLNGNHDVRIAISVLDDFLALTS
jgi:capsular polysaccharide biosynthesis protein